MCSISPKPLKHKVFLRNRYGTDVRKDVGMKKVLKWIGVLFFGSGIIAYASMLFTASPEHRPLFIFLIILFSIFLFLLLRKPKQKAQQDFSSTTQRDVPELGVSIKTTITPDIPPKEILRDMRKSYTLFQAQNDFRILEDCIRLIQTTTNFDTFFMRSELGKQKALTLRQAEQAKIKGIRGTQEAVTSMFSLAESQKERLLTASFEQTKQKVSSMSTARGKKNNWNKYLEQLQKYQDEFDVDSSDLYTEIIHYIERELESLEK